MSVTIALQLMLSFGTFVLILLGLVIELIKLSQKKITITGFDELMVIYN
ncbi:putative holin-like toxin [Fructobacillus cardui]